MAIVSKKVLAAVLILASGSAMADNSMVRWTAADDADGSVAHVLSVLSQKLGRPLTQQDFLLQEDRDLAFNHYRRLVQLTAGVPEHGKFVRIWTALGSDKTVQVEADLAAPKNLKDDKDPAELRAGLSSEKTMALARAAVTASGEDVSFRGSESRDEWRGDELVRVVRIRGKRGKHEVRISLRTRKVVAHEYAEFPQADAAAGEISLPAQVFQIYEQPEGDDKLLQRVPVELKHILTQVPQVPGDIYGTFRSQHYYDVKEDFVLGATDAGRAQGYWSMAVIKDQAAKIRLALPLVPNDFTTGLLLQGRYTSVNIHPDALAKFGSLGFDARFSAPFMPNWVEAELDGAPVGEMIPSQAYANKPLHSAQEILDRPARRLPDHDPKAYIADGFDEIQVYYAVDTLFEELHARGWKDPELSTRPFNAFLFNPDISMRDNAFYTDDTINFTTYSAHAQNFARDNSTIWHELGHGVMDRLMGDNIELADTGGLSEGMADFVAAMVIQAVTNGVPFPGSNEFRIINKMGFNLTNEVHDDGEAYGGTMKDFMDAVIAKNGPKGLDQVVDVVLEAMRLSRDYPGLTAPEWFKHILFADSLGRPGLRAPGELSPLLLQALAARNFKFDGGAVASFAIVNTATSTEIVAGKPGSRNTPIGVPLPKDGTASFELQASVKSSDQYAFRFPVTVRVQYNGGPLQGAIHWVGEEKGSQDYVLKSEADSVKLPLKVAGTCDEVNREDGSCVDFAYVQIFNAGESLRPAAKKRFYLRVKN
jgi:hypothetical protein